MDVSVNVICVEGVPMAIDEFIAENQSLQIKPSSLNYAPSLSACKVPVS